MLRQVPTYVVEPRDRATFNGKTLLIIPDMTGVANRQNRQLAGTCLGAVLNDVFVSVFIKLGEQCT